jgi:hypothetical protein
MKEADIGYYESTEIFYEKTPGTWAKGDYGLFHLKWDTPKEPSEIGFDKRILPEIPHTYNLGESNKNIKFKTYKESIIKTGNLELFKREFIHD